MAAGVPRQRLVCRPCAARSISRPETESVPRKAGIRARRSVETTGTRRLPMIAHSGLLTHSHLLTVAGAAQVSHLLPV